MNPLTDEELAAALERLDGWSGDTRGIRRTVEAASFLVGLGIVQAVGLAAEAANHHPDIDIRWRKLTFALSTHDVGGRVSELDVEMAQAIDEIVREHGTAAARKKS
jgi:4a-hydroxytetrahydrobiopterin dehydratase